MAYELIITYSSISQSIQLGSLHNIHKCIWVMNKEIFPMYISIAIYIYMINMFKVVTKIGICHASNCHAVPLGQPFCLYYTECNIPCFKMWFLVTFH